MQLYRHTFVPYIQQQSPHHTRTHTFNVPLSGTTRVSRYQKGKTNLDFSEVRDGEWQRHQLGHMQVCTSLQTDNHASTPPLSFFAGRMPFLPPNQQRQSTEGSHHTTCREMSAGQCGLLGITICESTNSSSYKMPFCC